MISVLLFVFLLQVIIHTINKIGAQTINELVCMPRHLGILGCSGQDD